MKIKLNPKVKWIGAGIVFLLCLFGAYYISMGKAPDEEMRYQLPYFIFKTNTLPIGNEPEIINGIWGFSYGYTPYLPSLISVVFMKIASIFTSDENWLFFSSRLVSVLSLSFTWIMCCNIGERLFKRQSTIIFFSILVCFLPLSIYLGSYLNNDIFAVFTSSLIIYFWIKNDQENWETKDCVLLGASIGLCALAYYNAYGFILCSIFFYCASMIKHHNSWDVFLKKALLIFLSAFLVGGWFFIRNFIIHHGDFLGMKSMYESGELYALDSYKPSMRNNPVNLGWSFGQTFLMPLVGPWNWFESTIQSFIGVFGFMEFRLELSVYTFYYYFLGIGFIAGITSWILKHKKDAVISKNLFFNLIICIIIPILLSMYYSYFTDFQPQGRYIISGIIPLMLITAYGYEKLLNRIIGKIYCSNFIWIFSLVYFGLFLYSYFTVMIPACHVDSYISENMESIIQMY